MILQQSSANWILHPSGCLIKSLHTVFALILALLVNVSITKATLPTKHKRAIIRPRNSATVRFLTVPVPSLDKGGGRRYWSLLPHSYMYSRYKGNTHTFDHVSRNRDSIQQTRPTIVPSRTCLSSRSWLNESFTNKYQIKLTLNLIICFHRLNLASVVITLYWNCGQSTTTSTLVSSPRYSYWISLPPLVAWIIPFFSKFYKYNSV